MSLVPYSSRDSRDIVLRHNDAIVVRDPSSKQLTLRGAADEPASSAVTSSATSLIECPYCQQSFPLPHGVGDDIHRDRDGSMRSPQDESFVSPEYFRMLHDVSVEDQDPHRADPPSSPIRRLVQPQFPSPDSSTTPEDAEFVTSQPAASAATQNIRREAFSPNYFHRFFVEERELGRGGKGVVLLVRHILDGVPLGHFACKRVPVGDDHAWLEKVLVEVQLLQTLSHPNLVSYRHVWLEDVQLSTFGPSVPCAFILQQYCNAGDLLRYIVGEPTRAATKEQLKEQMRRRSKGGSEKPTNLTSTQVRKLSFEEIYSLFKDITSGLGHLHDSNYIHRDLKPSNCLLHRTTHNGQQELKCLISDFGEVQAENIMRKSTGATGTISYCAPEVLKQDGKGRLGNFTTKSDIFSLGMILYFLCFGRLPYSAADVVQEEFEDLDQLRAEISAWSGFREERRERPDLPNQLYDFLKVMLSTDPDERPTADDILHAIRTGTGLHPPQRHGRNSTIGGSLTVGKRIQPLDSSPPGTPTNSGKRLFSSGSVFLEDADETSSPTSDTTERRAFSPTRERTKSASPGLNTPLLMPPPSGPLGNLRTQVEVFRHNSLVWAHHNTYVLTLSTKMIIFIVKLWSLTWPCMPAATSSRLLFPLACLGALDVGLGLQIRWAASAVLLLFHALVLCVAMWRGALCEVRDPWTTL